MKDWRLKQIDNLLTEIYKYGNLEETGDCWQFSKAVDYFNNNCKITVADSVRRKFDVTIMA